MSLVSDLESTSSRVESPVGPDSNTSKAASIAELAVEGSTPPASGSTTPTAAATDASKKGRSFLGFSPFTEFLRGRYPSSVRISGNNPLSISENSQEMDEDRTTFVPRAREQDESDEEEDRNTIHGVIRDDDLESREQRKPLVHDANISLLGDGVAPEHHEKLGDDKYSSHTTELSVQFPQVK